MCSAEVNSSSKCSRILERSNKQGEPGSPSVMTLLYEPVSLTASSATACQLTNGVASPK